MYLKKQEAVGAVSSKLCYARCAEYSYSSKCQLKMPCQSVIMHVTVWELLNGF